MVEFEKILDGKLPEPENFPACFAFSVHKAGSTLMNKMIKDLCALEKIPAVSIPDILFREGILDADWRYDSSLLPYFSEGRVYYGFRYFPEVLANNIDWVNSHPSVLLVRDPRDALVSEFFSYGGSVSHAVPKKNSEAFIDQYSKLAGMAIDDYVKMAAHGHLGKLKSYLENLNFEKTKIFRYEEIFFDKAKFLKEIFSHFGLSVSDTAVTAIADKHDIRPTTENIGEHIRKAAPGDHAEKLKPETIAHLNGIFRETCSKLGYSLA